MAIISSYAMLTRFEDFEALRIAYFYPADPEWDSSQETQGTIQPVAGADYGVDPYGNHQAPVRPAHERWRVMVPNEEVDELRNAVHTIGRGRLWMKRYDGVERWAWARCVDVPGFTIAMPTFDFVPLVFTFVRLSDWYAAEPYIVHQTVTDSSEVITIENDGLVTTRSIVITLTANTDNGFVNPTFQNMSSNELFTIGVTGNSGDILRVDAINFRAEVSIDGGVTWTDVTSSLSLANNQVSPMSFILGGNVISFDGASDADATITFYPAWR